MQHCVFAFGQSARRGKTTQHSRAQQSIAEHSWAVQCSGRGDHRQANRQGKGLQQLQLHVPRTTQLRTAHHTHQTHTPHFCPLEKASTPRAGCAPAAATQQLPAEAPGNPSIQAPPKSIRAERRVQSPPPPPPPSQPSLPPSLPPPKQLQGCAPGMRSRMCSGGRVQVAGAAGCTPAQRAALPGYWVRFGAPTDARRPRRVPFECHSSARRVPGEPQARARRVPAGATRQCPKPPKRRRLRRESLLRPRRRRAIACSVLDPALLFCPLV